MSEECHITVTDIKHYAYCEVIIYITHILGVREPATDYMEFGKEIEREKSLSFIVARLKVREVLRTPYMNSRELGLCGSPDYVVISGSGDLIPVEIKWAEPDKQGRAKKDHVLQLATYALLLEKTYVSRGRHSVKKGYIYYLKPQGKLVGVNIDYSLKLEVLKTLKRIREILEGRREPKPSLSKCASCNFLNSCPYSNLRDGTN
ncbi:MAG: CRISPR-associated protein Cas4 [Candidatus Nezhaarchaeales archaeon]